MSVFVHVKICDYDILANDRQMNVTIVDSPVY